MAVHWEYLVVRWYHQRLNPPDASAESAEWTTKYFVYVSRPGSAEPDVVSTNIYTWRTGMTEWKQTQKEPTDVFVLMNELGADGWECFSTLVMSSVAMPRDGYETGGTPTDIRYYFKRPKDA